MLFTWQHFADVAESSSVIIAAQRMLIEPAQAQPTAAEGETSDSAAASTAGVDAGSLAERIYELLRLVVDERADTVAAVDILKKAAAAAANRNEIREHVVNGLWLLGVELETVVPDTAARALHAPWKRLVVLVQKAVGAGLLDRRLALATFSKALVSDPALRFVDGERLDRTLVKTNTKLRYMQKTFNLLREESEGYAKLAALLAQITPSTSVAHAASRVVALVGNFLLAPNRVLDLILEAFEACVRTLDACIWCRGCGAVHD